MKIGVVGARGRLGFMIMRTLAQQGIEAIAIEEFPHGLDALINTAPLQDAEFHQMALTAGCHVIDVTIGRKLIREMLTLDAFAREQERSLIAMAGLAPGLAGLLASDMLARVTGADKVQVSLLQSSAGTAGKHGVREMIDLLTRMECHFEKRPYPHCSNNAPATRKLFDFDTPELDFLDNAARMAFVTGFDRSSLNRVMYAGSLIRRIAPWFYLRLRNMIADQKAKASEGEIETIELGALALTREGTVLAQRLIRLTSDYGTTAAVACSVAISAATGLLPPGAGCLGDFVELNTLLEHPIVKTQILSDVVS